MKIEKLISNHKLFGVDEVIFKQIINQYESNVTINDIAFKQINQDYYGGRGDKIIAQVTYNNNKTHQFFIKRHAKNNPNEALHYQYLTKFAAPIPYLYAYYSKVGQQDIIITEVVEPYYVDDDPVFMLNEIIFKPFIEVTALFNSVTVNDEYKNIMMNDYDLVNDKIRLFGHQLHRIFKMMDNDLSYINIKKQISKSVEGRLIELNNKITKKIEKMELGLYHWDHKVRNMGYSTQQQLHVLFDLEDTLWGPRFYNIGMWLGGENSFEPKFASREKLAKMYLDIYNEKMHNKVSVDHFLDECYPLWIAYKMEELLIFFYESGPQPYRIGKEDPSDYKREMEEKFINHLNLLLSLSVKI